MRMNTDLTRTDSGERNIPDEIERLTEALSAQTGLDEPSAKTAMFYAVITHRTEELVNCPILVISGPSSTGKTTTLNALKLLVKEPREIDGRNTPAVTRDELFEAHTAVVEEADDIDEKLLQARYAQGNPEIKINRAMGPGYIKTSASIYGATILHRRKPFRDHATLSRAITLTTRPKSGDVTPFDPKAFEGMQLEIDALAGVIPWSAIPPSTGGRVTDTWEPLMQVANELGDEEWILWADEQVEAAKRVLSAGQAEEAQAIVFRTMLTLALGGSTDTSAVPLERIQLSEIRHELAKEGIDYTAWQVGQVMEDLGLEKRQVGGQIWVYTDGAEQMVSVALTLGIEDYWVKANEA